MKLSLSVRVAESSANKREVATPLREMAPLARAAGYEALCMRASVLGVQSSIADIDAIKSLLVGLDLAISMVTADFGVPENGPEGPSSLRDITPSLDLAQALGSDLIRVCMKTEDDIAHARRAAERGLRLVHQSHVESLFETVDGSVDVLQQINRPNFGLIYEPANLALCGQVYGRLTLDRFQPYLFNVYVKNHAPDDDGDDWTSTWINGRIRSRQRPLDAPGGIDFDQVFESLHAIGYDGYVTMHQALGGALPVSDAIAQTARFLSSYIRPA